MADRNIKLPNGMTINNVPEDVSDEEAIRKYEARYGSVTPTLEQQVAEVTEDTSVLSQVKEFLGEKIKEGAELLGSRPSLEARRLERADMAARGARLAESGEGLKTYVSSVVGELKDQPADVGLDFAKVFYDKAAELKALPLSVMMNLTESGRELKDLDPEIAKKFVISQQATPFVEKEEMYTPEGDLKLETVTGMTADVAAEIGTYMGVGAGTYKVLPAIPRVVRGLASGVVTDQILADPEENIFNVVKDTWPEHWVNDYTSFMATEEDDPEVVQRLKLIGEGLTLGALGELIGGMPSLIRKARGTYNKSYKDLTEEEKGEVLVAALTDAKAQKGGWVENRTPQIEYSQVPITDAQVAQQNSSGLNRFIRQMFTTRGYWTPAAYNAFQDSQYAQRAIVKRAENVANRLQIELDNIVDSTESLETAEKVQQILVDDLSFIKGQSKEAAIQDLRDAYGLSNEIASEVYNARNLIDEMSKNLVNSSAVPVELKEIIAENSGSYLRRSYRLYEDAGYKPDPIARRDAESFLIGRIMKANPELSYEEVVLRANNQIDEILGDAGKDIKVFDEMSTIRRVNKEILAGRKDIPPEIRALMGEIKSPTENIVLTAAKMAQLSESSRFYDELYQLGRQGNYIFDKDAGRPSGIKWEQITGTNSNLDGKWTTPEIITAIKGQESRLVGTDSKGPLISLYQNFLTLKGTSQKMKTVYSHVTHLRNISGGAQFGLANGMNPFSNAKGTLALLKNELKNIGQEGIDAIYEKYLRLGIINTNVRVNEFRELLDTGYKSVADGSIDRVINLAKSNKYGAKILDKAETIEDFYLATDDFYKINGYLSELDTLKRAYPDRNIAELEEMAAAKIRDTFPNYDRVPKGIKATRELPFGNFVAFPTEIVRTSYHILGTAIDEIGSGNAVMRNRGLKRLAGFSASMYGWHGLSKLSSNMLGLNEEEKEALDVISETPWSKSAPRIYIRIDDKIHAADTQFLDSYSFIKEPLMLAYDEIASGKLKGQEAKEYIANGLMEGVKKLLTPYTDPAILSSAVADVYTAMNSPDGRTTEGKPLFVAGLDTSEKIYNGAIHILESFAPGSATSIQRGIDAFGEKPNEYTGRDLALEPELITNMSGIKFTELSPEDRLKFSLGAYQRNNRNILSSNARFGQTAEEVREVYYKREKERYRNQQELYRIFDAVSTIIGREEAIAILWQQDGISNVEKGLIAMGKFNPEAVTKEDVKRIIERVDTGDQSKSEVVTNIVNMIANMKATELTFPEDEEDLKEFQRYQKAKGGEVFGVPKAPSEPDERIDKMTGLPYNIQAGTAFIDEEDRAGLAEGGTLFKSLAKRVKDVAEKGMAAAGVAGGRFAEVDPNQLLWAKELGKAWGKEEELDGKGDAARHLALGWIAQNTKYPKTAKFYIDAREVFSSAPEAKMDRLNNSIGFALKAKTQEEAERRIRDLVERGKVAYLPPKSMKGFAKGGRVLKACKS